MLQKMIPVLIVSPKRDLHHITELIYNLGTVHLEDISADGYRTHIRHVHPETWATMQETLLSLRAIISSLPEAAEGQADDSTRDEAIRKMPTGELIAYATNVITSLQDTTRALAARKTDKELAITTLTRYKEIIGRIRHLEEQIPILEGYEVTILLIPKEYGDLLDVIRSVLTDMTRNRFEMTSAAVDETTLAAICVFSRQYSEQVHSFLYSKNVNEVRIPEQYSGMSLEKARDLISQNIEEAKKEIEAIDRELRELSVLWFREIRRLVDIMEERRSEYAAYGLFGETDYTVMIRGYVPKRDLPATKDALSAAFGDKVAVLSLPMKGEMLDRAPVYYDNPRWVKPFEFFMRLASPPRYREIDPVPLLAIFFPFFFGVIVGDVGYGLVILAVGLFMRYRFAAIEWLHNIAEILIISSIPTIIFGFLFGEFFGDFGEMLGIMEPIEFLGITWNRVEAMIPMLMLAIGIGFVHVVLGLSVGLVNAVTRGKKRHIFEKTGMIMVLVGILLILGSVAQLMPEFLLYPGLVVIIIAIPLIVYGGGTLAAIEIMSTIGNVLSYGRLMAIGMASVVLAIVANRLGGTMEVIYVGILIAALLHALNIILAMFSPSIHAIRLHIVEFYSKFYEGGGEPYQPFGKPVAEKSDKNP